MSRLHRLVALAQQYAPDCMGLAGVVCIVRGVALVSPAAAWIVGGVAAIGAALLVARHEISA